MASYGEPPPPPPPYGAPDAARRVQAPALALLITNILFLILFFIYFFVAPTLMKDWIGQLQEMQAKAGQPVQKINPEDLKHGPLDYLWLLAVLVLGGLGIYGAIQMRNLQSYGMAMTGTIASMIPCLSPCCITGIPLGIWALVVLNKPEVKSAFR